MLPAINNADAELVQQLCFFAKGRGRGVFGNFTPQALEDYIRFHAAQGTMSFCRADGAVTGIGFAWQLSDRELHRRHAARRAMFDWTPTDPEGDALFIANVIAVDAASRRALVLGLIKRFPGWAGLKIYTYRKHGHRLRRIAPLAIARLLFGHEPATLRKEICHGR
jgi:hypothetical protein